MGEIFYMKETERMGKGFFEQLPTQKGVPPPSCLTIDDDCCNFNIDIIKKQKDSGGRHQAAFICQHGEQGNSYDLIKIFQSKAASANLGGLSAATSLSYLSCTLSPSNSSVIKLFCQKEKQHSLRMLFFWILFYFTILLGIFHNQFYTASSSKKAVVMDSQASSGSGSALTVEITHVSATMHPMMMTVPRRPMPLSISPSITQEIAAVKTGSLQRMTETCVDEIPVKALFCSQNARQVEMTAR